MTEQLPTLPGKVDGIVGLDPLTLQCRNCGATHVGTRGPGRHAIDIILSGYKFHTCNTEGSVRLCPDCLADAVAAFLDRTFAVVPLGAETFDADALVAGILGGAL